LAAELMDCIQWFVIVVLSCSRYWYKGLHHC